MDLGGEGAYSVLEQPESAFSQALAQAVKWDRAFKYVEGTLGDIDDEGLVVLLEGPGVGSQACLKRDPSQRTCGSIHCHCMI